MRRSATAYKSMSLLLSIFRSQSIENFTTLLLAYRPAFILSTDRICATAIPDLIAALVPHMFGKALVPSHEFALVRSYGASNPHRSLAFVLVFDQFADSSLEFSRSRSCFRKTEPRPLHLVLVTADIACTLRQSVTIARRERSRFGYLLRSNHPQAPPPSIATAQHLAAADETCHRFRQHRTLRSFPACNRCP